MGCVNVSELCWGKAHRFETNISGSLLQTQSCVNAYPQCTPYSVNYIWQNGRCYLVGMPDELIYLLLQGHGTTWCWKDGWSRSEVTSYVSPTWAETKWLLRILVKIAKIFYLLFRPYTVPTVSASAEQHMDCSIQPVHRILLFTLELWIYSLSCFSLPVTLK